VRGGKQGGSQSCRVYNWAGTLEVDVRRSCVCASNLGEDLVEVARSGSDEVKRSGGDEVKRSGAEPDKVDATEIL
jgi:hypothetical protein